MKLLHCVKCGAIIYFSPDDPAYKEIKKDSWVQHHEEWHRKNSAEIHAAAQVGARGDMMTTPLGG